MAKATPADTTPVDENDPLAALDMTVIPKQLPANPKAVQWIENALQSETRRGRVPLTTEAQFEVVRAALRRAAEDFDDVSVTCSAEHDNNDDLVALTFYAGKRKGRKDA